MNLDGLTEEQKRVLQDIARTYNESIDRVVASYREENTKAAQPKYKFRRIYVASDFMEGGRGPYSTYPNSNLSKPVEIFDRERLVRMYNACRDDEESICYEEFLDSYLANEKE